MSRRSLLVLPFLAACTAGPGSRATDGSLTPEHQTAMRDSVKGLLDAWAADASAPPIGKKAREAVGRFYDPGIIISADLAPDEPVFVQTIDSLIPPDEVVSLPSWVKSTRLEWGTMVITPLAPGVAMYTGKYVEHVIDSTGTVTDLPGVQSGVVRNGANGWRFVSIQSSHPMAMHQRQSALAARMSGAK